MWILILSCSLPAQFTPTESFPTETIPAETLTPTSTIVPTATEVPIFIPEKKILSGDQFIFSGDYENAFQDFETAFLEAQDDEMRSFALLGMGKALFYLEDYPKAIEALNKLVEIYPESDSSQTAHFYLGYSFYYLDEFQSASNELILYSDEDQSPISAYIHELRGNMLTEAGQYSEANSAYLQAKLTSDQAQMIDIEVKIARNLANQGDQESALEQYLTIYEKAVDDHLIVQMNYLIGQIYQNQGLTDLANVHFLENVNNYPEYYDSYTGLIHLIDNGYIVEDIQRGLTDFFAGVNSIAFEAFQRHIDLNPEHDGTAHYYSALILRDKGEYEEALEQWQIIMDDHPEGPFWEDSWDEKAYTLWAYLDRYDQGAKVYLDFVDRYPNHPIAPTYLFRAGRTYERNNNLEKSAEVWGRMIDEYPVEDISSRALFLSAISTYRSGNFDEALTIFQRYLVLASKGEDQAAAQLWMGKIAQLNGDLEQATQNWQSAANLDPTGYYSERARELLQGSAPLQGHGQISLDKDLKAEKNSAIAWMKTTFALPGDIDLENSGQLVANPIYQSGLAYWEIGKYELAVREFEELRLQVAQDPINSFRLLSDLIDLGFYRTAVFTSRQILNMANFDDLETLTAPIYFNHIRFGTYFEEIVTQAALNHEINPLLLYSVIRQESMFQGYIGSFAGARGAMQIMPATGKDIAQHLNWPENYSDKDLTRIIINIPFGAFYLANQRDYFDGNIYAALAAYNAGPGNAFQWAELSQGDPDLFFEIIRFSETRDYLIYISENFHLYERFYNISVE